MKVRVLFFGATAAAVGKRETFIELRPNSNVATALDSVLKNHPALESQKLLFSINEEYVRPDTSLSDGDDLAVFTPVSGG